MRLHIENKKMLDQVDFSSNQETTSDFIGDALAFSFQFIWSGATGASGDLVVYGSIDNQTFVPLDSYTISGESDGSRLVNVERAGYSYTKASWAPSGGTGGSLTIWLSSKNQ